MQENEITCRQNYNLALLSQIVIFDNMPTSMLIFQYHDIAHSRTHSTKGGESLYWRRHTLASYLWCICFLHILHYNLNCFNAQGTHIVCVFWARHTFYIPHTVCIYIYILYIHTYMKAMCYMCPRSIFRIPSNG